MSLFFYLFVNLNSGLSSSISPFLSHTILHLSTSIFLYLLANIVDAYLSLLQILNSLFISHYIFLQQKKISPLHSRFPITRLPITRFPVTMPPFYERFTVPHNEQTINPSSPTTTEWSALEFKTVINEFDGFYHKLMGK